MILTRRDRICNSKAREAHCSVSLPIPQGVYKKERRTSARKAEALLL